MGWLVAGGGFFQTDVETAVLVFKLFQTMSGHKVQQPFELLDVHTRYGDLAGARRLFVLGCLHERLDF